MHRTLRGVAAVTVVGLNVGFGLAGYRWWRRRQWLAGLDLVRDPAFAFPMVRVNGFCLPLDMYTAWERLQTVEFHPDDVIVASFPKSGTTWVQEMAFLLLSGFDFIAARASTVEERAPYLEYVWPGPAALAARPRPRLLKTHLPASLLPPGARAARIVYIERDPRDVAVSYFHFARMFAPAGYRGGLGDFLHRFLNSQLLPYAPWARHVREYRELAAQPGTVVLLLTYEELSADPRAAVRRLADFLGLADDLDEVATAAVAHHCRFDAMRANPATNYVWWDALGLRRRDADSTPFMRKGQVGDWRNFLSDEEAAQFEALRRTAAGEGGE